MNRTGKLMTAVTSSLLAAGAGSLALPPGSAAGAPKVPPECTVQRVPKVADPEVKRAVDQICKFLSDVGNKAPMSADEIAKEFAQLKPAAIEAALKVLVTSEEIVQTGDGTADSPYRYYGFFGHTG
jgi:hypothetical protein